MLNLNGTPVNIDDIETVGYNTTVGNFAQLVGGTRVAISFAQKTMILELAEAAEEESLLPPEHLIEDYAEYHRNSGEWAG